MKKEEEIILKARVTTLEEYLQDVFIFLDDVTQLTKDKVKSKLRKFREDMDYQDRAQSELEK